MASLDLPDDPAMLKGLVRKLTLEKEQGARELRQREEQLEQARQEWEQTRQQLELDKLRLRHQLTLLQKRYYGPRADRVDPAQLALDFALALEARPIDAALLLAGAPPEVPGGADPQTIRRVRLRGRGRRDLSDAQAFAHLPVIPAVHDLPEEQRPCPCCGTMRKKIGQESTWQIERFPATFCRIEHVQVKYACPQCEPNGDNPQIVLADKPLQPIDKGLAGPGLLAYVITSKFADYLPLYRLEHIFSRNGLEIDRSTMSLWAGDVADLVKPLYKLMVQRVLSSHVVHTDDTPMPMQAPGKTRAARMWVYAGDQAHPYNVFDFTLSRARDGPAQFLGNFNQVLQADAYGGYDGICLEKSITQAGCWAHGRRKLVDCQSLEPTITGEALALIGRLFTIEQQARDLSPAQRLSLRQAQSLPVLGTLRGRLLTWREQLLPKHPVAQALAYILNQWLPLTVFTTDPAVALDNNLAEREMKRQALNRKNSLFVGNERGGRTAAILSSFTSTCRRHDIDPQLYLTQLLTNLPATSTADLDQWLPDRWKLRQLPSSC